MSDAVTLHDLLVEAIANRRFRYPNSRHPEWDAFTNTTAERTKGVDTGDGIVYPDIVVVNSQNRVALLGEVETFTSITRNEALQWTEYAGLCSGGFYLYVPDGYEDTTIQYIRENNTRIAGLRTYDLQDSELVITNM